MEEKTTLISAKIEVKIEDEFMIVKLSNKQLYDKLLRFFLHYTRVETNVDPGNYIASFRIDVGEASIYFDLVKSLEEVE